MTSDTSSTPFRTESTPQPQSAAASFKSISLGLFSLLMAGLCYWWVMKLSAVDLGENDFSGLFYLLSEIVLFMLAATLMLFCLLSACWALLCENRKGLASLGMLLGIAGAGILALAFMI
jgi:hypothetical protein